jgi:hypothetical protein
MPLALSAYNSVDVIREAQGTVTDAVIVVFNAAMVDVLSEDQKRCVLKGSGESGDRRARRDPNGFRTVCRLRKTGVTGRDELAKPLIGETLAESCPDLP